MPNSQSSAIADTVNPFTPLTIKGEVAVVHLTKGKYSVVDAADWPLTQGRKWTASRPGGLAWYATGSGRGGMRGLHQLLLPGHDRVDHRDRDGLNNRRSNLRPATHSQNSINKVHPRRVGVYRGVFRVTATGWYQSALKDNGARIYCGTYTTAKDAALAYDAEARRRHGEFAILNFPNETRGPNPANRLPTRSPRRKKKQQAL